MPSVFIGDIEILDPLPETGKGEYLEKLLDRLQTATRMNKSAAEGFKGLLKGTRGVNRGPIMERMYYAAGIASGTAMAATYLQAILKGDRDELERLFAPNTP